MITYTYVVKCPECADEFFDFFDEAKEFAMSCMGKKPIITQTEVNRNDFGECTDHSDLGQVWSWEDECRTDAEPAKAIFTKDDLKDYIPDEDPEFGTLDNSVDFEPETSEVSPVERKPIPEGMTIEQLVEEMEENEDTVECVGCEELFPKEDCTFNKEIGWVCPDCEDRIVKCTWCDELYDKSECRYEVDLGWLCDRCEAAIKSRGETLTFREGSYWDFLDESVEDTRTLEELVKDSINHLTGDLGKDPWADDFADDVIADIEKNYDTYVPEDMEQYRHWCSAVASEVSRQVNNQPQLNEEVSTEKKTWTCYLNGKDVGTVEAATEEEAYREMEKSWYINNEDAQVVLEDELDEELEPKEIHDLGNEYDGGYPKEKPLLPEIDEVSDSKLTLCPECGEEAFDRETGICVSCGFN